jgi:hypothetical protein
MNCADLSEKGVRVPFIDASQIVDDGGGPRPLFKLIEQTDSLLFNHRYLGWLMRTKPDEFFQLQKS